MLWYWENMGGGNKCHCIWSKLYPCYGYGKASFLSLLFENILHKNFPQKLLSGSDKNHIKRTIDRHHFFSDAFGVVLLIICKLYPRWQLHGLSHFLHPSKLKNIPLASSSSRGWFVLNLKTLWSYELNCIECSCHLGGWRWCIKMRYVWCRLW